MQELSNINSEKLYSSIFLVEQINLFRKSEGNNITVAHSDLLKKIEKRFNSKIIDGKISLSQYRDSIGRSLKMYELPFEYCLRILMDESETVQDKCVEIMKAQQKEIKRLQLPNFLDPAESAIAWATEYKAKQLAESKLIEMQPKADFYDIVTDSSDGIDLGTASKVLKLGYGRNTLFEKLRERGVLMKDNMPYQDRIKMGWFKVIETPWFENGKTHINCKTLVLQKGLDGIRRLLSA